MNSIITSRLYIFPYRLEKSLNIHEARHSHNIRHPIQPSFHLSSIQAIFHETSSLNCRLQYKLMRNNELCTRHKTVQTTSNDRDNKLSFLCLHKACPQKFKLCCLKCRSEFHKDHSTRVISTVDYIKDFDKLKNQLTRRQQRAAQLNDLDRKLMLIKDFRLNLNIQEASLIAVNKKCISTVSEIEKFSQQKQSLIEKFSQEFRQCDRTQNGNRVLAKMQEILEFNVQKMKIELSNDKTKNFQEIKTKLQQQAEVYIGRTKEYLMKIIQVLLDTTDQETKKMKKETNIEANVEEMKKILQTELTQLEKEITEKSILVENIRDRLGALGVPTQKQQNSNSHTPKSTKRGSQLGVNDLPLVRSQSRTDSRPEYMSADKNAAIQEKRNQHKMREIEAENAQLMSQIRLLQNKLNENGDLKRQLDKITGQKQKAVIDFKQISEQYNELIYQYNSLKDRNLQTVQPQQMQNQIKQLEHQKSKLSEEKTELIVKLESITKQLDASTKQLKSSRQKSTNSNNKLENELTQRKKQLEIEKKNHIKAKSQINALKQQLKMSKQSAESKKKLSALENQVKSLKAQNEKTKLELKNSKTEQQQIKSEKQKLKNEHKKLKQLNETTKNDITKLQNQINDLKNAQSKANQQASKRKYDFDCLVKETNILEQQVNKITNQLKQQRQTNSKNTNQLNCLKSSLNQSEQHCKNLLKQCESFRIRYDQLSNSYEQMSKQCEIVKTDDSKQIVTTLTSENTKLINQLSKINGENSKMALQVRQKTQYVEDLNSQMSVLSNQLNKVTAQNKQLKSQIQELSNHCGRLNKQNKQIFKQLESAHEQLQIRQDKSSGQCEQLKSIISKKEGDIARKEDEIRRILAQRQSDIAAILAQKESIAAVLSQKETQIRAIITQKQTETSKLKQYTQQRQTMLNQMNGMRQCIENMEGAIIQLTTKLQISEKIKNEVQLMLDKSVKDSQRNCKAILADKDKLLKQLYTSQSSLRQLENKSKIDQVKLKESDKKCNDLNSKMKEYEDKCRQLENRLVSADKQLLACDNKIKADESRIKQLENKCISLDSYCQNMELQLKSTIQSLENYKNTAISQQQMLANHSKQFSIVNQEYKNACHQVTLLSSQLNSIRKQLHQQQLMNDEIRKGMIDGERTMKQLDQSHRVRYELDMHLKSCVDELQHLGDILQQKDKEIAYLKNEIDERIKVFEFTERRLFDDQNALERHYEGEIGKLMGVIQTKDSQIGNKNRKIEEISERQNEYMRKIEQFEGKEKSLLGEIESLKMNVLRQREQAMLKNSDIVLFHKKIQELQLKVEAEKRQTMTAEKNSQELRYQIEELTKLQNFQQKQKQALHNEIKQLLKIKQDLQRNMDDIRGHVQTMKVDLTQHDGLKKRCQQLQVDTQDLRDNLSKAYSQLQSSRMQNKQIESMKAREISRLNEANLAFCQKLQEAEEKREKLQSECHLLKNQCSMLKKENEQLRAHLAENQQNQKIIKMLQDQLMRKNHDLNKMDIDNRQLKLEIERVSKSRAADEGTSRIIRTEEIMNLNREISSTRQQLNEEKNRNRQLLVQLDNANRKNIEMGQKLGSVTPVPVKLTKNSQQYRAIHQIIVTLKEDMTVLQGRIKRKDDIEKIYLKELEVKKSQEQRLRQQNEILKRSIEQQNRATSTTLPISSNVLVSAKPGQALARVKNKENKIHDGLSFERLSPYLQQVHK